MIDINWVKENFKEDLNIFVVGCADLAGEGATFKYNFKKSKIYAFECENGWLEQNMRTALNRGIYYFQTAVFSENSKKMFIPSVSQAGEPHPWSGSFYKDIEHESTKIYGDPYEVTTIRLDTFCDIFDVTPDFMFIDAEGSEYEILSGLGNIRPKAIWTEILQFCYDNKKTFEEFDSFMDNLGYKRVYPEVKSGCPQDTDALYCLKNFNHTDYTSVNTHFLNFPPHTNS